SYSNRHWHSHYHRQWRQQHNCYQNSNRVRKPYEAVEDRRKSNHINNHQGYQRQKQFLESPSQVIASEATAEETSRRAECEDGKQDDRKRVNRVPQEQNEFLYHRHLYDDEPGPEAREVEQVRKLGPCARAKFSAANQKERAEDEHQNQHRCYGKQSEQNKCP